jgi:hypothetical protein
MCMRLFWVVHKRVCRPSIEPGQATLLKTALAVFFLAHSDSFA